WSLFCSPPRRQPRAPLFPYTTLFRSRSRGRVERLLVPQARRASKGAREAASAWDHRRRVTASPSHSVVPESAPLACSVFRFTSRDRKSTRLNSSHVEISYAVVGLKKT